MGHGKYASYTSAREKPRPWKIHPIWRGIGIVLLILIPFISYIAAVIIDEPGYLYQWGLPYEPSYDQVWFTFPGLGYPVSAMILMITGVLSLISFAIIMIFYAIMYSVLGPPRYGPLDAPPEQYVKKRKFKQKR
jgi:hypothetical protein